VEDPQVATAVMTGEGLKPIIADIDGIALECQQAINEFAVVAFPDLEKRLGKTLPELVEMVGSIDLEDITAPTIRQGVAFARVVKSAVSWEQLRSADLETGVLRPPQQR
jgi:hypothetical protein